MRYEKTIVCFANSRKTSGRCIAGKEWHDGRPGGWVRPVSARPTHEISEEERRYQNGRDPQLLDILDVPCKGRRPLSHQQENHLVDPSSCWVKRGRMTWSEIHDWLDHPETLWGTGQRSYAGINNRISAGQEDGRSLYLIRVERLRLLVGRKAPEYPDSKRAVRGEFTYRGILYRMDITDPVIERHYLGHSDGRYEILEPVLCVSLGDLYKDHYYKLLAAVLYQERFR